MGAREKSSLNLRQSNLVVPVKYCPDIVTGHDTGRVHSEEVLTRDKKKENLIMLYVLSFLEFTRHSTVFVGSG